MIRVYNSLTHSKEPLVPQIEGRVSVYVCGVTPYDQAHIGHARPAVIWDVIKRHLERRGYVVFHVQNFTDIDDKMIIRARERGESVNALAERNMKRYLTEMRLLGVDPPQAYPRVTENMKDIVRYIDDLIDKGFAYATDTGDVYFDVSKKPDYGKLSRRSVATEETGHRAPEGAGKQSTEDFALWKAQRPGEPCWLSPWGSGRPGWHIECSAMSEQYLGPSIDLHGGGIDLVFPHHENEIAQTEAHLGKTISTIFVHNGLVTIADVKMSKSQGNGITLESLLGRWDPAVLRTYLLSVHYRSPLAFDEGRIAEWQKALERVWAVHSMVLDLEPPSGWPHDPWVEELLNFEEAFLQALDDDFNTPRALALIFDMVRKARPVIDQGGAKGEVAGYLTGKNLRQADQILGFLRHELKSAESANENAQATVLTQLVEARQRARSEKDYDRADMIRQALGEIGWGLEDTPAGPRLVAQPRRDGEPLTPPFDLRIR